MQIVIDIPESIYETIKEEEVGNVVYKAIKNCTPLPKGHGRLIDCSQLHLALDSFMYGINGIHEYIDDEQEVPTIIEADKESELHILRPHKPDRSRKWG